VARENEGNADMHADALALGAETSLAEWPYRIGTVDLAGFGRSPRQRRRESRFPTYTALYFNFDPEHHFIDVRYCIFRVEMRFAPLGIMPGIHRTRISLPLCVYRSAIPFCTSIRTQARPRSRAPDLTIRRDSAMAFLRTLYLHFAANPNGAKTNY
jgi:hypothetical protein